MACDKYPGPSCPNKDTKQPKCSVSKSTKIAYYNLWTKYIITLIQDFSAVKSVLNLPRLTGSPKNIRLGRRIGEFSL